MRKFYKTLFLAVFCLMVFFACRTQNPRLLIKTELGDITVEVFEKKTPITASNFLKYVDKKHFHGASFYRVVTVDNQPNNEIKIEVIQGGIRFKEGAESLPPVEHETTDKTGVLHKDGVISMARDKPGTASSEFFICVGDQPELDYGGKRNPDGQGFAAFGRVVKGMDVVRRIHRQAEEQQMLTPRIKIQSITRIK